MALTSLLLLAALASSAIAQSDAVTVNPAPTSTMTMMPTTTTPTPMATPMPLSAEDAQREHFFCLGENTDRRNFTTTPSANLKNDPPVYPYRWGLWIQYPVLSYLDSMRKRHLFFVISEMVSSAGILDLYNRTCIAEVEHYGVSTYRESVFVKLYIRDSTDELATIQRLDSAFQRAYVEASPYTTDFLGRLAIDVSSANPPGRGLPNKKVTDSVHPGCDIDSCPEGDPTLLAIVIGTYVGRAYYGPYPENKDELPKEVTVETLERLQRGDNPGNMVDGTFTSLSEFAENPRPINYGLEAGDIVFAVFGSIFLTILSGAIILGFVIHPFCLA